MITLEKIDIFQKPDLNGMVHQANCFHTMGGGIARIISERFPAAYLADKQTGYGDKSKLGTFSMVNVEVPEATMRTMYRNLDIFNCYSQFSIGAGIQTEYPAVEKCFELVKNHITEYLFRTSTTGKKYRLGIPYGYGCGLAGGNWTTVEGIILDVFDNCSQIDICVCKI